MNQKQQPDDRRGRLPGLSSPPRGWRTALTGPSIISVALIGAVGVIYIQTLSYQFVQYDDEDYVYNNAYVRGGLSPENVLWALTSARVASNWHPLTWWSHMLDWELYGDWAGGHHLSSVLIHAAAAVALFHALWRLTGDLWPAAFVAAVFAVHPLRVESVAWVAERKDVLSGLFFALTLWVYAGYVRSRSRARYLLVVGSAALAMMAKPMVVTLPCVLLLLDYWPLRRFTRVWSREFGRRVVEKLPLVALSAVTSFATMHAQGEARVWAARLKLEDRVANAAVAYLAYIEQSVVPVDLAVYYPHPEGRWSPPRVAGAAAVVVVATGAAAALTRRAPYLIVGWLWYLGMLVPVIGIVQVGGQARADRYTYLPQVGLLVGLAWGIRDAVRAPRWALGLVAAGILGALSVLSWAQTKHWQNTETLFAHALVCTEANAVSHGNLGAAFLVQERYDEALAQFSKAFELEPTPHNRRNVARAHCGRALRVAKQGRLDEAIAEFRVALEVDPSDATSRQNLAIALIDRGVGLIRAKRVSEAAIEFQLATEASPELATAWTNLGRALFDLGRYREAAAAFRSSLSLNPHDLRTRQALQLALTHAGS